MRDLLREILANPDDDAPRLVYADALTERGDPRGELIVVQCLLARGAPDREQLEAREAALLKKHARAWLAPIRTSIHRWQWERGFLRSVAGNAAFFPGAAAVFAAHPVMDLQLTGLKTKKDYAPIATLDLPRVRTLNLQEQRLQTRDIELLLGPNLASIETLLLGGNPIDDAGVVALATRSRLSHLRMLSLRATAITDAGLFALAASPILVRLERLGLRDTTHFSEAALEALTTSPLLPRLARVDHMGCEPVERWEPPFADEVG